MVFIYSVADGEPDGDSVLQVHAKLPKKSNLEFSENSHLTFASSGLIRTGGNGTLRICAARGEEYARAIVFSASGRPGLATESDDNGIIEDQNNDDLDCPP